MPLPPRSPAAAPGRLVRRPVAGSLLALAVLAACAPGAPSGAPKQPSPEQGVNQMFNIQALFQRLGHLAAGPPLPFVGSVDIAGATGDSVTVVVSVSMGNRALVFQKNERGFDARYSIDITLEQDSLQSYAVQRNEVVRVSTFGETQRTDETILFRQNLVVPAGTYRIAIGLHDLLSDSRSRAEGTFVAPPVQPGGTSGPILVYEVKPRTHLADTLHVLPNVRGMVVYGGDSLRVYVEGYRMSGATKVPLRIVDQRDSVVLADTLAFRGGGEVEGQVVEFQPSAIPLGQYKMTVGPGGDPYSSWLLVSFAPNFVLSNFEELLNLLRYFGHDSLVAQLRTAPESERPALWRQFWRQTDPNPDTPENEALDLYFSRLASANQHFRDEGIPGWRTDRGEVFIILGDPDEVYDTGAAGQNRYIRWVYSDHQLSVTFVDPTGFGRYRMTAQSRADFDRVALQVRQQEFR